MPNIREILGPGGLLSQQIPGFLPREAQITMAEAIDQALKVDAELLIEAGTGTGKTFGYLIPIFIAQKKTIISTGTKNLQDQLFLKDIPIIKNIFPHSPKVELLKGRANYLCQLRLDRTSKDGRLPSQKLVKQLQEIIAWSGKTLSGDISEIIEVPEDSQIWPQVTSTADNCLNQDCEFYKTCFVIKARQKALAADIVIVNHHLFFADLALQEEGVGELLPGKKVVIFDEAHQIAEIAAQFFSTYISSRQILELARDCEAEVLRSAKDANDIIDEARNLQSASQDLRAAFGLEMKRSPWPQKSPALVTKGIDDIIISLRNLENHLKEAAVRSKEFENCWRRSVQLLEKFQLLTGLPPDNIVHWYETHLQSFSIQHTPMHIGELFKEHMKKQKTAWIFTSATLTVKDSFQLSVDSLGLQNALQLQLQSPFDYKKQALLYVPRALPDTRAIDYKERLVEAIIPVLNITKGRAFVLFTSYKALDYAADILPQHIDYPILVQGSMPKRELIDKFKTLGNAVLLATSSFWYGVDVRGNALSCVIIDKLPFSAPEDPLMQAKIQLLKRQGLDPFKEYQLPQAVITLKQGVGRLIRDAEDRGILVICDPRLVGARYGDTFLQSLPSMPRTRDINKVLAFFE